MVCWFGNICLASVFSVGHNSGRVHNMSILSLLGNAALALVAFAVVLWLLLALYIKHTLSYWRKRNVPYVPPTFPFGNYSSALKAKVSLGVNARDIYNSYRKEPYIGTYVSFVPMLQIHDPKIIKQIFVKEFPSFNARGTYSNPKKDPISGQLFLISGSKWKNLRTKLTPTFTTGKIKYMFERVKECANELQDFLGKEVKAEGGAANVDIRETLARFTTDIITSVAFGIQPNALKEKDSEFRRIGRIIFEPTLSNSLRYSFFLIMTPVMPILSNIFKMRFITKDAYEFMMKVVPDTVAYREKHNIDRPDFLNLMIQLKNKGYVAPDSVLEGRGAAEEEPGQEKSEKSTLQKLTMDEIVAQAFVFFVAGFETTSSTISFTLYELAKNQSVQDKVVEEIDAALQKYNGEITYDALSALTYTDQVISEALRLYPSLAFLTREVTTPCKLPLTDVSLETGTKIMIPVMGLHYDPEYFPNPTVFDPERFSPENKGSIPPFVYLPFGEGPRICIGMRFAQAQVKAALMAILSRFRVDMAPTTPREIEFDPRAVVPFPVGGMTLKLVKRN